MDFEITRDDTNQLIRIAAMQAITNPLAIRFFTEAVSLLNETGYNKILVDMREVSSAESPFRQYAFAYELDKTSLKKSTKIAAMTAPDDHSHDFVETVSRNAGYYMAFFNNEEEAMKWLKDKTNITQSDKGYL